MWHPERAVIKTPTLDEAEKLDAFCAELGFRNTGDYAEKWRNYKACTCFDYQPGEGKYRPKLWYASDDWYHHAYEDEIDEIELVPMEYFMITVDEFIAICESSELEEMNLNIDFDALV